MNAILRCAILMLIIFLHETISSIPSDQDVTPELRCNSTVIKEGESLRICPEIIGMIRNPQIIVNITGDVERVSMDLMNVTALIGSEDNCITIDTRQDMVYERNEVFEIILTAACNITATCTVLVVDDDGPNIECSEMFVAEPNITEIFQNRLAGMFLTINLCSSPHSDLSQCTGKPIDCTRWNASHVSDLLSNVSDKQLAEYFPNINSKKSSDAESSCTYFMMTHLRQTYSDDEENVECNTNCTAILSDGCNTSVFILEDIDIRRVHNFTTEHCGTYEITCCTDSIPTTCTNRTNEVTEISNLIVPIVGGAVGFLILLLVLVIGTGCVTACIIKSRRRLKERPSDKVQSKSIVYKRRRTQDNDASCRTSQDSISQSQNSTPQSQDTVLQSQDSVSQTLNSDTSPSRPRDPNPNYEKVAYSDTNTHWKKKFSSILVNPKDLEYEEMIGEGEFSRVYLAKYWTSSGSSKQVAIKKLKTVTEEGEIKKFVTESAIMVDFDHPNILRLLGVCFNTDDNLPAIVLPYMANRDLRTFLIAKRSTLKNSKTTKAEYPEGLSEEVLLDMCMDVARGMHYLSKCKFVHRDLAARNCMVDDRYGVKVADFGLSRDIHVSDYYRLNHRQKLPVKWMAPESLFEKIYNEKTDVWSYGIVCWEIFKLGKKPYAGIDNPDLVDYISHGYRPKKPSRCPDKMFDLMQTTWMKEPKERPDFRAIVLYIANLTKYKGDIEKELRFETTEDNPYEYEDPSRSDDNWPQESNEDENVGKDNNVYSVLEEPVYKNCSSEGSLKIPEEYEVPTSLSYQSEIAIELQEREEFVAIQVSENPIGYETPQFMFSNGSVSTGSPQHSSMELEPPYSKVDGGRVDDNRYLKLNYPTKKIHAPKLDSIEISEKRYSKLEWRDKTIVSFDSRTLPNKKQRIYHTLEQTAASQ